MAPGHRGVGDARAIRGPGDVDERHQRPLAVPARRQPDDDCGRLRRRVGGNDVQRDLRGARHEGQVGDPGPIGREHRLDVVVRTRGERSCGRAVGGAHEDVARGVEGDQAGPGQARWKRMAPAADEPNDGDADEEREEGHEDEASRAQPPPRGRLAEDRHCVPDGPADAPRANLGRPLQRIRDVGKDVTGEARARLAGQRAPDACVGRGVGSHGHSSALSARDSACRAL